MSGNPYFVFIRTLTSYLYSCSMPPIVPLDIEILYPICFIRILKSYTPTLMTYIHMDIDILYPTIVTPICYMMDIDILYPSFVFSSMFYHGY